MKVLWLCSWYPNAVDPYDGDFIQRHAEALALYQQVDIIHVVQNKHFLTHIKAIEKQERKEANLSSTVYFLPLPETGLSFLNVYLFNKRFQKFYLQLVEEYITANGKPDLIHVHVPVKAGLTAVVMNRLHHIPFVVTEHSSAYFDHIPENYFSRNRYFRYVTKQSFRKALAVSSVSNWLLKRLHALFDVRQTQLIRNVVDNNLFYAQENNHTGIRFIHVSMMHPLKNVQGILKALSLLKEQASGWQMLFVGPVVNENVQLAEQLGLAGHITWLGTLPYDKVAEAMRSADALVHFSNYENLPCVVNEALCCGLPVFSSNVGGIAELVNLSNGVLVAPGNSTALAEVLYAYLQKPLLYNKTEIAAGAAIQFSKNVIGKELQDWYLQLLPKKN
ncbi:MAG: glycosyltransferase family 4 protein [Chitinophagaceae bacterium]|nr:glycosyltransferase family 4 protein [Chitinophagaceae bacterium]